MEYTYTVVQESEIMQIHEQALRVLADVGMRVMDDKLCNTLAKRGLSVNGTQQLVRFPAEVVTAALDAAPKRFSISDHKGNQSVLETGNTFPAVYSSALKVWDWHTKQVRPSKLKDLVTCLQLAEAIDEVRIACPVCLPGDAPEANQMLRAVCTMLQNSSKINEAAPQDLSEIVFWLEAIDIAEQDLPSNRGPSLIVCISPTSPLQLCPSTCEVLQYLADRNVALLISSCPMAGGTSPVTMAGTTLQTHAEFLAILTIAQLLREGIPAIYAGSAAPMDLRTGNLCYGAAERNTMLCANIDIANHFGLPHYSAAGTVDSAAPDIQTGQSKALTWLTRLMKGSTLGLWFGSLLTGSTVAPEQIVLDADLYRSVKAMLKGMPIDEERLAYEAIKRVGPGGSYLADEHTVSWMRSEYYLSNVINHEGEKGKSMLDRAHDQVQEILQGHKSTVSTQVQDDLEKFLRDYTKTISP